MSVFHVEPINDLIEHEDSEDCLCGPTVEHVPSDEGDGWVITHHSLDGREKHEEPTMNNDPEAVDESRDHECTFVEEQEPSGRLVLGPCLSCGLPAMEALLGLQAIVALHAADVDGNCGHCTRGRVYPVPAPCETVRALAGGGEGR